jgi:hypothetical protein
MKDNGDKNQYYLASLTEAQGRENKYPEVKIVEIFCTKIRGTPQFSVI